VSACLNSVSHTGIRTNSSELNAEGVNQFSRLAQAISGCRKQAMGFGNETKHLPRDGTRCGATDAKLIQERRMVLPMARAAEA
jgi:hypothetical protein